MSRNGSKIMSKFDRHHIARLPHPPYSPDWASATFGSSGCWKESWRIENSIRMMKLKRRLRWLGMISHSMRSMASFTIGWTDLDGSLRTGESTLLNKDGSVYLCLLSDGIGAGAGDFLPPVYLVSDRSKYNKERPSTSAPHRLRFLGFRYPFRGAKRSLSGEETNQIGQSIHLVLMFR
jgi:hypothetical protein